MHSQWQGLNTIAFLSCLASNLSSTKNTHIVLKYA